MPLGELVGKVIGFVVVTAVLVVCGILVLLGHHASSDYLNTFMAAVLILVGLGTAGFGTFSIVGSIWTAKQRRREAVVHITPRSGPPSTPPAWGMNDVGRPGVVKMDRALAGADGMLVGSTRGSVRVVGMAGHSWDIPLGIGLLLAWTTVGCVLWSILAPH